MTPEAWSRLREVFAEVYECDPETRRRRLRERCGTDRHLEAEVARLVELHDSAGDFLETPAVRIFPDEETDAPRPGDAVGPYRLVREIARGGMGADPAAARSRAGRPRSSSSPTASTRRRGRPGTRSRSAAASSPTARCASSASPRPTW